MVGAAAAAGQRAAAMTHTCLSCPGNSICPVPLRLYRILPAEAKSISVRCPGAARCRPVGRVFMSARGAGLLACACILLVWCAGESAHQSNALSTCGLCPAVSTWCAAVTHPNPPVVWCASALPATNCRPCRSQLVKRGQAGERAHRRRWPSAARRHRFCGLGGQLGPCAGHPRPPGCGAKVCFGAGVLRILKKPGVCAGCMFFGCGWVGGGGGDVCVR